MKKNRDTRKHVFFIERDLKRKLNTLNRIFIFIHNVHRH